MVTHLQCSRYARWLLAAAMLVTLPRLAAAADPPVAVVPPPLPAHRLVVRFSDAMLNSLMAIAIDREADVRDNILGTEIYGRSRIVANRAVRLQDSPDQATFHVAVDGTAVSRSTGYNGPAIIYSHSVTRFTATKQVVFEPSRGFYALPPQVHARTTTYTDGVGSTRGGIVGRIVRRRAGREVAARHDEAQEIARQKAEQRITAAFNRVIDERLAKLNKAGSFRAVMVAALRPSSSGEPRYACCSTPHYLQIATNFGEGGPEIDLPVKGPASMAAAPVEIWIHQSLVGEQLAVGLQLLGARAKFSDFSLALAAASRMITPQSSAAQNSTTPDHGIEFPIRVRRVLDWWVVEVELPAEEHATQTARAG